MNFQGSAFLAHERIVRVIYSPKTLNPTNGTLKQCFVAFSYQDKSGKYELSCNRIEMDTMDNLRMIAKHFENPPKSSYYGLACTTVQQVLAFGGMELVFTPIIDKKPLNPSHCDIYDLTIVKPINIGEAQSAETNYRRSDFVKLWRAYKDEGNLLKEFVLPK